MKHNVAAGAMVAMARGEAITHEFEINVTRELFRVLPYYSFKLQRIDLVH